MNVSLLEEKQIASILSVSRYKSFAKAAEELNYTESAISKHIAAAEKYLGFPIFERRGRSKVYLTADGEAVLPYLEKIHQCYRQLETHIRRQEDQKNNILRFASINLLVPVGDDELLAGFLSQCPEFTIHSVDTNERDSVAALREGRIDAGMTRYINDIFNSPFFAEFKDNSDFRYIQLTELTPMMIAVRDDHPALKNGTVNLRDLRDETFFFKAVYENEEEDWKYKYFVDTCRSLGFEPKTQYCRNLKSATILQMVAEGICASPTLRRPLMEYQKIVFAHSSPAPYHVASGLYYLKSNRSKALRALLNYIEAAYNIKNI